MKQWTYETALAERNYIMSVDPKNPDRTFNHDPECFANYCNMQGNDIAKHWPLIGHDILQARDIACPDYRTQKFNLGWIVRGVWCADREEMLPPSAMYAKLRRR